MAKSSKAFVTDGTNVKSLNPWDADSMTGWTKISGGDQETATSLLYSQTAWLYGCIDKRASACRSIPLVLMRGGTELEELIIPNMKFDIGDIIYRMSTALDLYGKAYLWKEQNRVITTRVRWIYPGTIEEIIDEVTGLAGFWRTVGAVRKRIEYDDKKELSPDLAWAWLPGLQEDGPPPFSPADVASGAALVLRSIDQMSANFFERGAISQHLITTDQNPPQVEKDRVRAWFKRLFFGGLDTSHEVEILNSGYTVQKLGSDPKDLEMTALDADNRRDISAVFKTPEPLITGDAGSMARATLDRLTANWLEQVIFPQLEISLTAINHHILEPMGYRLEARPQGMAINQEEERQRAQAWTLYVSAGMEPETAAAMLGLDIPEDMELMAEKQPIPEQLAPTISPEPDAESDDMEMDDGDENQKAVEVGRLKRYVKAGKHLKRPFESDVLTPIEVLYYTEEAAGQDAPFPDWQGYP